MTNANKSSRRRSLVRKTKRVCAVLAVLVLAVAGLWYWIRVPFHQFTIINDSEKKIEMKSLRVGDVLVSYYENVVLDTESSNRKSIFFSDNVFLYKRFRKARIAVTFRFLDERETREYVSEANTGWKYECRFVIWIEANRIVASECRRPEIYDFR